MSDSFHHHAPDIGSAGHHMHTDLGITHHPGHSSHPDAPAATGGAPGPGNTTPEYGSPDDVNPPDRRPDHHAPHTMATVRSRSAPAPISIALLLFVLVFFVIVAAFIAHGAHTTFSDSDSGPSISVPSDGSAPNQP